MSVNSKKLIVSAISLAFHGQNSLRAFQAYHVRIAGEAINKSKSKKKKTYDLRSVKNG